MLNQFYIVFENKDLDSFNLKHIQYNIQKRLRELKYITYRRIDILLVDANVEDLQIEWDDKKSAYIKCFDDFSFPKRIDKKTDIATLYAIVFKGIELLWKRNQWTISDLKNIQNQIEKEGFVSSISYGKPLVSPDKKYKADFVCELHPGYADYYLRVLGHRGALVQKILFLHGHPDPSIFFNFFSNHAWRDNEYFLLSDINKEIFYIFNVNESGFSLEYRPLNNTLEECKNYVAAFQANIPNRERLRLLGLPSG